MMTLRSLIFAVFLYAAMAVVGVVFVPFALFSQTAAISAGRAWARAALWGLRWICGVRVTMRAMENLPDGPFLLAMKHQSMLDTFIPFFVAPAPAIVLKKELLSMPIFGWYARRAGFIPIDRDAGASALKSMLATARAAFDQGRAIVIFPEGTRQEVGAAPDYKPGVAALYRELNAPCAPVAVNTGLHWPAHGLKRTPGEVVIEFLAPIPPGLTRREFMRALEDSIETHTNALTRPS